MEIRSISVNLRKIKINDIKRSYFERRPISVNLRKIKINDIKTVIFLYTFKAIYFNADNNIIIPKAHKGVPYRNPSSFDQVNGLLKMERRPILVNLRKIKINDIKTVIFFNQ